MQIAPSEVIERLKTECPSFKTYGSCVDFAAAKNMLKNKMPAAFVIPLAENASPNTSATMLVSQRIAQQFGVIVAVTNMRDASGAASVDALYLIRKELLKGVIGWVPEDASDCVEFVGGTLLDMDDQVVWWQDTFKLDVYFRSA